MFQPSPVPPVASPAPAPAAPAAPAPAAPAPAPVAPVAPPVPDTTVCCRRENKSEGSSGDGDVKMIGRDWRSNVALNKRDVYNIEFVI